MFPSLPAPPSLHPRIKPNKNINSYLIASRMPPGQVSRSRESRSLLKEGPEGSQWSPNMEDFLAPLGLVFRPPGDRFSFPEGCEMALQRLPGASWGPGRRQEGTLVDFGRKRVSQRIVWTALGAVLGPSWRLLSPIWVTSPPSGRGQGSLGEHIFGVVVRGKAESPPNSPIVYFWGGCVVL